MISGSVMTSGLMVGPTVYSSSFCIYSTSLKKSISRSVPFFFPFQPFRSVPFTSVLTVYRRQTVLALGMNSSAKFTACVGEA